MYDKNNNEILQDYFQVIIYGVGMLYSGYLFINHRKTGLTYI